MNQNRGYNNSKVFLIFCLFWIYFPFSTSTADYKNDLMPVFISGREGYNTFRIPSLIRTSSGALLAFCEGRKKSLDDSGDIDLVMKRSDDNGKTWSDLIVIWDDGENTCGNPCPVIDNKTGTILLLLTWNRGDDSEMEIINGNSKDTRRVFISRSLDNGKTWSVPEEITSMAKHPDWTWYATGPGVGIQKMYPPNKGRLIIPCDHANKNDKQWYSHIIYSDDEGKTWSYSKPIGPKKNECQVVELANGDLLLNMRNYERQFKCRAISSSSDGGITWRDVTYDANLIEPICQASFIQFRGEKSLLLFSNPASEDQRVKMTIKASDDEGRSWEYERLIYPGPSAYSCLCQIDEDHIGIFFECGDKDPYERIVFNKISIKEIIGRN